MNLSTQTRTTECPSHKGQPLDFFCNSHYTLCCSECKAKGGPHDSCDVVSYDSVILSDIQTYLSSLVKRLGRDLRNASACMASLSERRSELEGSIRQAKESVNAYFAALEAQRSKIISDLDRMLESNCYASLSSDLGSAVASGTAVLSQGQRTLAECDAQRGREMVQTTSDVLAQARALKEVSKRAEAAAKSTTSVSFSPAAPVPSLGELKSAAAPLPASAKKSPAKREEAKTKVPPPPPPAACSAAKGKPEGSPSAQTLPVPPPCSVDALLVKPRPRSRSPTTRSAAKGKPEGSPSAQTPLVPPECHTNALLMDIRPRSRSPTTGKASLGLRRQSRSPPPQPADAAAAFGSEKPSPSLASAKSPSASPVVRPAPSPSPSSEARVLGLKQNKQPAGPASRGAKKFGVFDILENSLFVENLPSDATVYSIYQMFDTAAVSRIRALSRSRSRSSSSSAEGGHAGRAIISFDTESGLMAFFETYNGHALDGAKLSVKHIHANSVVLCGAFVEILAETFCETFGGMHSRVLADDCCVVSFASKEAALNMAAGARSADVECKDIEAVLCGSDSILVKNIPKEITEEGIMDIFKDEGVVSVEEIKGDALHSDLLDWVVSFGPSVDLLDVIKDFSDKVIIMS